MGCSGNTPDHCCYVAGVPCRFLEEDTVEGRHWACGLRRRLGSWAKVHASKDYRTHVKPHWTTPGVNDCGDWPLPGETCAECGATG